MPQTVGQIEDCCLLPCFSGFSSQLTFAVLHLHQKQIPEKISVHISQSSSKGSIGIYVASEIAAKET